MPSVRQPSVRAGSARRGFGPLALALLLHGLALGAAATLGFTVVTRPQEVPETIALRLATPWAAPEVFVPELAPEPAPAFDPPLPDAVLEEPAEPELSQPDLVASLPPPEELVLEDEIPTAVPLTKPDLTQLDFGALDQAASGAAGAGKGLADVSAGGVAGVGAGTAGKGPGGNGAGGPGTGVAGNGTGAGTGASLSVAPRAPVIREPRPVDVPPPSYPRLSRRNGEEGSVLCRLYLSSAGLVTTVEVLESSGFARLDDATREKLAHWRFEPRLVDGRAVESTLVKRITYRLDG